ncbi:glycosyltransferase [Mycobacterium sp. WMMD1722]|uniref:glycosyltransferase n=1 Tax=Mycobacterium sp. WMMD1722 TaxID=3404117 RepID=UPI003BF5602B
MIGYYVHHHGRGHLSRALAVSGQLAEDAVFFSSAPRPAGLRPGDDWVQLPLDVPAEGAPPADPTAGGRLHWAPLGVDGLARRSATLLNTIATLRPRRMVVDVSVEVTLLCRLAGVPVTVMAMPGERGDAVHQLAYDVADTIIAPWSDAVYRPPWLRRHEGRTHYVGVISRFDGMSPVPTAPGRRTGLLLAGAGGSEVPADALTQLRQAAPEHRWVAAGGAAGWVDALWPLLCAADVVVTHAGQSAVADIAAARVPAVVIPQRRPFDEQHATAAALGASGVAVTATAWPRTEQWRALLAATRALDPARWQRLRGRGAAGRAAAVLAA